MTWKGAKSQLQETSGRNKDFSRVFGSDILDLSYNWVCKVGERCTLQNYICTGKYSPIWSYGMRWPGPVDFGPRTGMPRCIWDTLYRFFLEVLGAENILTLIF